MRPKLGKDKFIETTQIEKIEPQENKQYNMLRVMESQGDYMF